MVRGLPGSVAAPAGIGMVSGRQAAPAAVPATVLLTVVLVLGSRARREVPFGLGLS